MNKENTALYSALKRISELETELQAHRKSDIALKAARYDLVRSGKAMNVRVPVKDKFVTYCIGIKPEEHYGECLDAVCDDLIAKAHGE